MTGRPITCRIPCLKRSLEISKSKDAHRDGIFAEYSLDGGKLWMEGKLCVPDALAPRVLKLVAQMGVPPRTWPSTVVDD